MAISLSDKTVVITGASSGIGAELARIISKTGASVVICARRGELLAALADEIGAAGGRVLPIAADVSRPDQAAAVVRAAIEHFGAVDVLVNNAGRGICASVEDITPEQLESIFAVNAFALWYTAAAALPSMKARKSGHIVTVSSVVGSMGYPFCSAYVAAKHAAIGFHAALRTELLETGVRATLICPDGVNTPWSSVTESGNYGSLFADGIRRSRTIAKERNIPLAPLSRMISAAEAARIIYEAIINEESPADIYTHPGTHERAIATISRREDIERAMLPAFLGVKEEYESRKHCEQ